jgi:CHAD domain-containing protein
MPSSNERLLSLMTRDVVARVACRCLDYAADGLRRLKDPTDTEALHDFRVSVRRLRSLLRAYRPWMGRSASKKLRRRLGDLGRQTNAGRDAEAQIAWLEAHRDSLQRRERAGLNGVLRRLRKMRGKGYRRTLGRVRKEFEKVEELLRSRLASEVARDSVPFVQAFGELLERHATDLQEKLSEVRSVEDEAEAHSARISAKRLRYLIEPVIDELADGRSRIKRLRKLQDILGELNDLRVLMATLKASLDEVAPEKFSRLQALAVEGRTEEYESEGLRDECVGILALATLVHARRDVLFAELQSEWLDGRARRYKQPLCLEGEAMSSAD